MLRPTNVSKAQCGCCLPCSVKKPTLGAYLLEQGGVYAAMHADFIAQEKAAKVAAKRAGSKVAGPTDAK